MISETQKTRTESILRIMTVLAWIAFILLLVYSGGVLFAYLMVAINPDKAIGFFPGRDMSGVMAYSYAHYTVAAFFMFAIPALTALVAYQATKVLSKVKLTNPFRMDVALNLESMSYSLLVIWAVDILGKMHNLWLLQQSIVVHKESASGDGLLMAGLVFVISQIFKRGVEIQSENELTV